MRRARAVAAHARACSWSRRTTRPDRSSSARELERLTTLCGGARRRDHRRRSVRRLRARRRCRDGAGSRSPTERRADVLPRRAVEVGRAAAGEARWIAVGGPATVVVDAALARLEFVVRHVSCRSRRRCRWPPRSCWSAARVGAPADPGARGGELSAPRRERVSGVAGLRACSMRRAAGTRCSRCRRSRPKRISCSSLLTNDGVLVASRLLLRLSARVVSRRQPAAARGFVSATGIARVLRHFDCSAAPRMSAPAGRRRAGLLIPLFSCPSTTQLGHRRHRRSRADDAPGWPAAGQRVLQLLPLNEMAPGAAVAVLGDRARWRSIRSSSACRTCRSSPRSAARARCRARRSRRARRRVARSPQVDYAAVRRLKHAALRRGFERFREDANGAATRTARAQLRAFVSEQAWWIEDYALFRAIHAREDERPWTEWPEPLRAPRSGGDRSARARELSRDVLFYQYLQWLARLAVAGCARDGRRARRRAVRRSAVHGRRRQRRRLGAAGPVPARRVGRRAARRVQRHRAGLGHAGLPLGRRSRADDFRWLRERARRSARSLRRLPRRSPRRLLPHLRPAARRRRAVLHAGRRSRSDRARRADARASSASRARRSSPRISAPCPTSCAQSLARLGVPGFRVLRWERHWHCEGQPFRDPAGYPAVSVATSGTHDTEPMAIWWEHAPRRRAAEGRATSRRCSASTPAIADKRRSTRRCATRCSRSLFASGSDSAASRRFRTSSAGAIGSTSRRQSTTRTGPSGCRGRPTV